jgi:phospholipase/carboxylesterase
MNAGNKASGPHQGQPVLHAGSPLERASAAMIMVHGRGATAEDILSLAGELNRPDFAYLAPQAAGYSWYPNSFMAPLASNEPGLSSALAVIEGLFADVEAAGIATERVLLLGFSQGACLSLEFAARHARRYGGIAGLSGALIGPDGMERHYAGSLVGTPVFLGCSDVDFHIPKERVLASSEVLHGLSANVVTKLYTGMGHTVNEDELTRVRAMMQELSPIS